MPIVRAGSKIIYFAHVPKCAGSSVVQYFEDRFGALGLHDHYFHFMTEKERWSRTSPQHVNTEVLYRMFPASFFDHSVAVVRHPVSRMVSAYHFQIEVEKKLTLKTSFGEWLEGIASELKSDPFIYDNHVRPMDDIVPDGAEIFPLEQGLPPLINWLDQVSGNTDGPREIPRVNERGTKSGKITPTAEEVDLVAKIYARDFQRFGYDPSEKRPVRAPLEASPVKRKEPAYVRKSLMWRIARPLRDAKRNLSRG